jgi:hypothetical protein
MTAPIPWSRVALLVGRVALLIVVTLVLFAVSAGVSGMAKAPVPTGRAQAADAAPPPPAATGEAAREPGEAGQGAARPQPEPGLLAALLALCVLISLAVTPTVLRARWAGWRLAVALAVLVYGEMTVLSQLETVVYLQHVTREFLTSIFVFGALFAATFAVAAVLILGRASGSSAAGGVAPESPGWPGWLWRIAVVAVLHVATYYTAGYYLAWKNPAVRQYYGGSDPGSFLLQLKSIAVGTPWMFPYQLAQGVLWALLVVLLVRMLAGSRLQVAVIAAFFLGVIGPCMLLLPNPVMPDTVRVTHLVETIVSRVVFGFVAVWLLRSAGNTPPREVPA